MSKSKKFVQNDNNFAIAYYRFSSHSQNEASIDQQRQAAEKYAESKGFKIIKEYADAAISGTTEARPQYQLMLSEVNKLKPAALILWKTDRLGRDRFELLLAKKKIRDAGCKIHYVAEATPDDSSTSNLMEAITESFAEFYSRNLSENIQRGMNYNAENALYNGHKTLGYMKGEDKKYVIDPDKAPVVQRIFNDYASGKPLTEIANELNQQGVKTVLGRKFTVNGLRSVLHNDAYFGIYRYSDIVIPGGMPVLITQELFDKVQTRFAENKRKGAQRASGLDEDNAPRYWLTGKLYCGECGNTMQGVSGTSKTGAKHYYYYCSEQRKHRCKKRPIKKDTIENLVVDTLLDFLDDSENLASLAVDAAAYYKRNYSDAKYLEGLEAEKKVCERSLANIVRAIEQGIFSETMQARLMELESQKKALSEAIETERVKRELMQDEHSIQSYFDKYLHEDFSNPETRDMILEYFIDKIYLYDDRLVITGWYSDDNREITWEELNKELSDEFDSSVLSSTSFKVSSERS